MCGLAGIWAKSESENLDQKITKMTSYLKRRGPDFDDKVVLNEIAFGHTRLKILDPSNDSNQPYTDGNDILIFNGRIFNFKELREELLPFYNFKTTGDTEVLFRATQYWGSKVLDKLDGQFSFAFFNKKENTVILARDHAGICPLYFYEDNKTFLFSSEIKPILSQVNTSIDKEAVWDFMYYRYNIQNGKTLFKNINRFPPAHYMMINLNTGKKELHRYWQLKFNNKRNVDFKDNFTKVVEQQQTADVPVGMYLSGGIDSGALLRGFSRVVNNAIKTFTIKFTSKDPEIDRVMDLKKQVNFQEKIINFDFNHLDNIDEIIKHLEDPFGDLIISANYVLAQEATKEVKVVLSGEGGDESFCGYDHQRAFYKLSKYTKFAPFRFLISSALKILPPSFIAKIQSYPGEFGQKEKNKLISIIDNMDKPAYAYLQLVQLFTVKDLNNLFSSNFISASEKKSPDIDPIIKIFNEEKKIHQAIMRTEIEQLTLIINLTKQDRLSMAHGLESCVPLVSRSVLDYTCSLTEKELFPKINKETLINYSSFSKIKKRPFSLFESKKYLEKLITLFDQYITEENIKRYNIFDWEAILKVRSQINKGTILEIKQSMTVLIFCIWCHVFFEDQNKSRDF